MALQTNKKSDITLQESVLCKQLFIFAPGNPNTNLDMSKWGQNKIRLISNLYGGFYFLSAGLVLTLCIVEKD